MTTEEAIEKFLRHAQSVRRLSPHTVAAYRSDLAKLARGTAGKLPAQINAADIQRLLLQQNRAANLAKPASVARLLCSWRLFFNALCEEKTLAANPVDAVAAPKRDALLPKALPPDEMSQLLTPPENTAAENQTGESADLLNRDMAIMELLYSSGLRLSELTALNILDVDIAGGSVRVQRGKGGRGRVAPLGRHARAALKKWLPARRALLAAAGAKHAGVKSAGAKNETALFIGRGGARLGARAVQKRIDRHVKNIGFMKQISPHTFRHSCASHFLQSSGDLRATQELLGHKDISATQIYTRLDFQHLAAIYDTAHPRAKK